MQRYGLSDKTSGGAIEMSTYAEDKRLMDRAARAALRGAGNVEPNPTVGCVILSRDGQIVTGRHHRYGDLHAEADAVQRARRQGIELEGARVYVTLEPCTHVGKQPACAPMLASCGIGELIYAMPDPSEQAAGGAHILSQAGVHVRQFSGSALAVYTSAAFRKRVQHGMPWVIAKWAQTIDGAIATRTGDSKWISCNRSRRDVHRLRGRVDAVLTGIGTVRADNPKLTVRGVPSRRTAHAVVIDPRGEVIEIHALAQRAGVLSIGLSPQHVQAGEAGRPSVTPGVGYRLGRRLSSTDSDEKLDLRALLKNLYEVDNVTNVLVEAGPGLVSELMREDLLDELRVYVAPRLLGDSGGMRSIEVGPAASIGDAVEWDLVHSKRFDSDMRLTYMKQ